jgi:hypothetical protein
MEWTFRIQQIYTEGVHTIPFLLETTQSKYKRHKCMDTHWLHTRMDRSTIVRTTVTYSERHTTSIYHHDSYYYHHHLLLASAITAHILRPSPHTTSILLASTITGSWKSNHSGWMFQMALPSSSFLCTNPKWYVSRCCYEYTHSHMAIWSHLPSLWLLPHRCEYYCVRWLETL